MGIEKEIFRVLYNAEEPLTRYAIARKIRGNLTTVYNKIDELKELGIVKEIDGKVKKYQLQDFYYLDEFWALFIEQLKPIMRLMYSYNKDIEIGYAILLAISIIRSSD